MSTALAITLAVYAVFTPSLFYVLWRQGLPAHRQRVPVPRVLIPDTMLLTSDSDYVGLI